MREISIEDLLSFLDDALGEEDTARVERALRDSPSLRQILRGLMKESDRGEHSVGSVWRRERLSCPSREELGNYLLGILDDGLKDYIGFHLHTISCAFCLANLSDLEDRQGESDDRRVQRRRKIFESSAGYIRRG